MSNQITWKITRGAIKKIHSGKLSPRMMIYKFAVLFLILIFVLISSHSSYAQTSAWVWQKGVEGWTAGNTTSVETNMTLPKGNLNSPYLLNYVWVHTTYGQFLQFGFGYGNTGDLSDFYVSDGVYNTKYLNLPYIQGDNYQFLIYYNNGWMASVRDNTSGQIVTKQIPWTISGKTMYDAGIYIESTGTSQNIINSTSAIGTLQNITDQTLYATTDGHKFPVNTWYYNSQLVRNHQYYGTGSLSYAPPPQIAIFQKTGLGTYTIGFTTPQTPPTMTYQTAQSTPTQSIPNQTAQSTPTQSIPTQPTPTPIQQNPPQPSLSPLKQLKNGEFAITVQCPAGMVLMKKSFISVACVRQQTADSLVKRNWGVIIQSINKTELVTKGNMISIFIGTSGKPIDDDYIFVKRLGGDITYNFTIMNGFTAYIPKENLWTLENNPRVIDVNPDIATGIPP